MTYLVSLLPTVILFFIVKVIKTPLIVTVFGVVLTLLQILFSLAEAVDCQNRKFLDITGKFYISIMPTVCYVLVRDKLDLPLLYPLGAIVVISQLVLLF